MRTPTIGALRLLVAAPLLWCPRAGSAETQPAPSRATRLGFPYHASSGSFELHSDAPTRYHEWLAFANDARGRIREWYESHRLAGNPPQPIAIYMCSDAECAVRASEALAPAGQRSSAELDRLRKRGHYLVGHNAIVLDVARTWTVRSTLAHEISHAVMREFTGIQPPVPLDEGFAEILGDWADRSSDGAPEKWSCPAPLAVEALLGEGGRSVAQEAGKFLETDYWSFHSEAAEDANYARAWLLAKAAIESDDAELREWPFESIRSRTQSESSTEAFLRAMPAKKLESEVMRVVDSLKVGIPWWGSWRRTERGWHVKVRPAKIHMLVLPQTIPTKATCVARVRFAKPIPNNHKVWFAFDVKDRENFQCVSYNTQKWAYHYRIRGGAWEDPKKDVWRRTEARVALTELTLILLPDGTVELHGPRGITLFPRQATQWPREFGKLGFGISSEDPPFGFTPDSEIDIEELSVTVVP